MDTVSPAPPDFVEKAIALLGPQGYLDDPKAIAPYLADWRGRWNGHTPLVARPDNTAQVSDLVRLCAQYGVGITPQGGNTGLVRGSIPYGEILLSLTRMNRIIETDAVGDTITLEAGAVLANVQDTANAVDRLFPMSLGSEGSATIGGLISTNAGGVAVLCYGMMRDLVLGLEVVLPDGRIWDGRRALRKDNTGYDMKQVFIGAEGTLGVVTGAVLKLFPRPQTRALAWLTLKRIEDVVALYALIRSVAGSALTGFELIPNNVLKLILKHVPDTRDPCPSECAWRVLVEMSFLSAKGEQIMEDALAAGLEQGLICDAIIASNEAQGAALWRLRGSIAEAERAHKRAVKHDITLPIPALPDFIETAAQTVQRLAPGAEIICFGHIGDGNLHYNVGPPDGVDAAAFLQGDGLVVTEAIYDLVTQMKGSISAEHGIGLLRCEALRRHMPGAEIDMMCRLKSALDPQGLMNPGRIVSP